MYKDEKVGVHELLMFKSNQSNFKTIQNYYNISGGSKFNSIHKEESSPISTRKQNTTTNKNNNNDKDNKYNMYVNVNSQQH